MEIEPVQAAELRSAARRTLAIGLVGAIMLLGVALWLAIRVYSAGVLLYGQRPGLRAFVAAARGPR